MHEQLKATQETGEPLNVRTEPTPTGNSNVEKRRAAISHGVGFAVWYISGSIGTSPQPGNSLSPKTWTAQPLYLELHS